MRRRDSKVCGYSYEAVDTQEVRRFIRVFFIDNHFIAAPYQLLGFEGAVAEVVRAFQRAYSGVVCVCVCVCVTWLFCYGAHKQLVVLYQKY